MTFNDEKYKERTGRTKKLTKSEWWLHCSGGDDLSSYGFWYYQLRSPSVVDSSFKQYCQPRTWRSVHRYRQLLRQSSCYSPSWTCLSGKIWSLLTLSPIFLLNSKISTSTASGCRLFPNRALMNRYRTAGYTHRRSARTPPKLTQA